ncbi:glycosyltransferase family 39 protein [Bradyrhizobium sp. B124]|uniref:glycosyltransferase family 39 protein n=1 Tax=Bradyrhizobium sp. B124 TaxID=3140245 RepID=UPI0031832BC1
MQSSSLVIELIQVRPRLAVWIAVLLQATLWLAVALLFYAGPPPNLAIVLAYGREYQLGTDLGPPLAFWLADIAFRAAGNHVFGVYLLAQLCSIVTFSALYHLARAIVGSQQAVLAVLLTMTVTAFYGPNFGPLVAARPLWALLLLHSWRLIGQNRRNVWLAWSIEAGLLLLTTSVAPGLLLLITCFALATAQGRRVLMSVDPLYALLVIIALTLPYLNWLIRADTVAVQPLPELSDLKALVTGWALQAGGLLSANGEILLLMVFNSRMFGRSPEDTPTIYRPPLERLARNFVYFFAIAPALGASLFWGLFGFDLVAGGLGVPLMMTGLAAIVASGNPIHLRRPRLLRTLWVGAIVAPGLLVIASTLLLPWTGGSAVAISLPAQPIARFFVDGFERRTDKQLRAVAGDAEIASLISLDRGRPHLFLDATPERTPWLTSQKFNETGGIVVWRAFDTIGRPPAPIAQRFPGLVPEIPRAFELWVNGRQPPLRIGWAIVRPKAQ